MSAKVHGKIQRTKCPVCNSSNIENIWKIPYRLLKEPVTIRNHKLQLISSFDYEMIYHFSGCKECGSVFLNPYNEWTTTDDPKYVEKAKERKEWANYGWRVERILPFIQRFDCVVDVACGAGQNLLIFKEKGIEWKREVAIEVNKPCVEYLRSLGYEAYCRKAEERLPEIGNGTVDCVMFCEAFEHVEFPYVVVRNMANMLKSSGVLYLSAQAQEGDMFITAGESIATNYDALKNLFKTFDLEVVFKLFNSGKWILIGRKE